MKNTRATPTMQVLLHDHDSAYQGTSLSLLLVSVTYLIWCVVSVVVGPFAMVPRRLRFEATSETWPSGDEL